MKRSRTQWRDFGDFCVVTEELSLLVTTLDYEIITSSRTSELSDAQVGTTAEISLTCGTTIE